MAESERASFLNRLRRMSAHAGGVTDAQLLDRFAASGDQAAFELLLWRYAALVFRVGMRTLQNEQDCEDTFQSTFLALARHAGQISKREAVAAWLHKVAFRVALAVRRDRARRAAGETKFAAKRPAVKPGSADLSPENAELRRILDHEIERLPARFRAVVVLCYLEGKSVDDTAALLGIPRGTVASRLARGRERLRDRLTRRGLAPGAGLASLAPGNANPFSLIPSVAASAAHCREPGAATDAHFPPRVVALTREVSRSMLMHKLRTNLLVPGAIIGVLLIGGGLAVRLRASSGPDVEPPVPGAEKKEEPATAAKPDPPAKKPAATAPRAVMVVRPVRKLVAPFMEYSGRLAALRSVEVRPAVSGFVEKVCFKGGAEVQKGDVLFELDSRAARLAVEKAAAELEAAEAKVKQSDSELQTIRRLFSSGRETPENLQKAVVGSTVAMTAVQTAKVAVHRAQLELEDTKVKAPMSGRVGRSLVEEGTLVFRGQETATLLTRVTSLDPIGVTFAMDEASFLKYQRLQNNKEFKIDKNPLRIRLQEETGFPRTAVLEEFDDHFDPASRTLRVSGRLPNPDKLLLPGTFVGIRMAFGSERPMLLVPIEALFYDQGKSYVMLVGDGDVARKHPVSAGWNDNGMWTITDGLSERDRVIVSDLSGLHTGDAIAPRLRVETDRKAP